MQKNRVHRPDKAVRRNLLVSLIITLAMALLAIGLLGAFASSAGAVAAPVAQCSEWSKQGGPGLDCTVTIVSYPMPVR